MSTPGPPDLRPLLVRRRIRRAGEIFGVDVEPFVEYATRLLHESPPLDVLVAVSRELDRRSRSVDV